MIPVFIALYVSHKLWNKTRLVPLQECNFEAD
jgi:amino acid permease